MKELIITTATSVLIVSVLLLLFSGCFGPDDKTDRLITEAVQNDQNKMVFTGHQLMKNKNNFNVNDPVIVTGFIKEVDYCVMKLKSGVRIYFELERIPGTSGGYICHDHNPGINHPYLPGEEVKIQATVKNVNEFWIELENPKHLLTITR